MSPMSLIRPISLAIALILATAASGADDDLSRLKPPPPTPISEHTLSDSIRRGVEFLIKTQNKDGSWGSLRWTGGVDGDPLTAHHSFCVATTALCIEALLETGGDDSEAKAAVEKGAKFLVAELNNLKRADPGNVPNVWGHGYGIQTLAALHKRTTPAETEKRKQYEKLMQEMAEKLAHYETVNGGWFYYASGMQKPNAPSCSFVNAAVLVNLHRMKSLSLEPPKPIVDRALAQLKAMRNPDASFVYSQTTPTSGHPGVAINRSAG